jgi:hypothetical protein
MATIYHTRPSHILEIDDPYTAYQFDQAALWWHSQEQTKPGRSQRRGRMSHGIARDAGGAPPAGAMPDKNGRIRIPISKEQAKAKS